MVTLTAPPPRPIILTPPFPGLLADLLTILELLNTRGRFPEQLVRDVSFSSTLLQMSRKELFKLVILIWHHKLPVFSNCIYPQKELFKLVTLIWHYHKLPVFSNCTYNMPVIPQLIWSCFTLGQSISRVVCTRILQFYTTRGRH